LLEFWKDYGYIKYLWLLNICGVFNFLVVPLMICFSIINGSFYNFQKFYLKGAYVSGLGVTMTQGIFFKGSLRLSSSPRVSLLAQSDSG